MSVRARLKPHRPASGSVLILVLWLLIVLGTIGLAYSFSVRSQLQVEQLSRGRIEAYWAARAGIEKAKAILASTDPTTLIDSDPLFDSPEVFGEQPIGAALFSVVIPTLDPMEEPRFGLRDEGGRINVNTAEEGLLLSLPGMTEEMAQSLIDWRDEDDQPMAFGAEADYYAALPDPYPPRNGPLASVRELARVRGWAPLFHAAYPDPYVLFLPDSERPETADPADARWLMGLLTAWSQEDGLAPDGEARMDLAQVSENELRRRLRTLSGNEAQAIVAHRNQNPYQSPLDLLSVTTTATDGGGAGRGRTGAATPSAANQPATTQGRGGLTQAAGGGARGGTGSAAAGGGQGQRALSLLRVGEIIDYFRVGEAAETGGKVNINTAPYEALLAVTDFDESLAGALVEERSLRGAIDRPGWIVNLPGINESAFRTIYPRITTRSNRFGVTSRGVEPTSGATVTIEAVLAIEDGAVEVVYWREF